MPHCETVVLHNKLSIIGVLYIDQGSYGSTRNIDLYAGLKSCSFLRNSHANTNVPCLKLNSVLQETVLESRLVVQDISAVISATTVLLKHHTVAD